MGRCWEPQPSPHNEATARKTARQRQTGPGNILGGKRSSPCGKGRRWEGVGRWVLVGTIVLPGRIEGGSWEWLNYPIR